ncbi:lamin tail domain-containing protein [Verrucomicrobiales bacterium]|nr:lamin tail domain-containing protein [Verrucomicrobiales bacterium]
MTPPSNRGIAMYGAALLAATLIPSPAFASLKITEFLAVNRDALEDDDGDNSDWIEVTNTGDAPVDLGGWHLTDDAEDLSRWTFPPLVVPAGGFVLVYASDKNRSDPDQPLHTNFKLASSGEFLALVRPDGATVESGFSPSYPRQFADVSYGTGGSSEEISLIGSGAIARYHVPTSGAFDVLEGVNTNSFNGTTFDDSSWSVAQLGLGYATADGDPFDEFIGAGGDVQSVMRDAGRTTIYLRLPFTVADAAAIQLATLKVRYDDGFVAYLNGDPAPIASENAEEPNLIGWNTGATGLHSDPEAVDFEEFNIDLDTLQTGSNILSIHGLNRSSGSSDFLIDIEMTARVESGGGGDLAYFAEPTPGEVNLDGTSAPGPSVFKVTDSPERPTVPAGGGSVLLPITAEVEPTSGSLASVDLYWRRMYDSESRIPMVDDGTGADEVASDGIYTAVISTAALAPGEMLRWRVEAADNEGSVTRKPSFFDPLDADEYYGTVAVDPSTATSLLPVLHTFPENTRAADTDNGTRASIFYEGEFYDNVQMDIHGQSTRGSDFPKKSYDLDFNKGSRFRFAEGERRVKDINLLNNWADKSKTRNTLGYEIMRRAGHPAHFAFPVRVHRNGEFFTTADMVEDGDDRYLDRVGLGEENVLYKMYNTLNSSTNGVTKKTRRDEPNDDLQELINGLSGSTSEKRNYAYDNINIPETVNYLAAMAITNNRDHGHKNYYLYRDTVGDGEWAPLVWDVDLNLGRNWNPTDTYFDDDFEENNINTGPSNPLKQLFYNDSRFRSMFRRRVRTLMDEILGEDSASSPLDARVAELLAQIDPPDVAMSDADLDYEKWGSWTFRNGTPRGNQNTMAEAAARIVEEHFPDRRRQLQNLSVIPDSQDPALEATITEVSFDPTFGVTPATPDQSGEYFVIEHNESEYMDFSGWQITGAVEFTIPPGTSINGTTKLYVVKDPKGFRSRTRSPMAGEQNLVVGGYDGQLSARGETLILSRPDGTVAQTREYSGFATTLQQWLRITALNFHPTDPTADERAQLSDLASSDFEYIEFANISPDLTIDLSGASLTDGVSYTFPAGTVLAPGETVIVASNPAAFALRYNSEALATGFVGQLDNGGEKIRLEDAGGENVLSFSYDDEWQPSTDGDGQVLTIVDANAGFDTWDAAEAWVAAPALAGPSPVTGILFGDVSVVGDTSISITYTRPVDGSYSYELSPDLSGWETVDAQETTLSANAVQEVVVAVIPASTGREFFRIRVVR